MVSAAAPQSVSPSWTIRNQPIRAPEHYYYYYYCNYYYYYYDYYYYYKSLKNGLYGV